MNIIASASEWERENNLFSLFAYRFQTLSLRHFDTQDTHFPGGDFFLLSTLKPCFAAITHIHGRLGRDFHFYFNSSRNHSFSVFLFATDMSISLNVALEREIKTENFRIWRWLYLLHDIFTQGQNQFSDFFIFFVFATPRASVREREKKIYGNFFIQKAIVRKEEKWLRKANFLFSF